MKFLRVFLHWLLLLLWIGACSPQDANNITANETVTIQRVSVTSTGSVSTKTPYSNLNTPTLQAVHSSTPVKTAIPLLESTSINPTSSPPKPEGAIAVEPTLIANLPPQPYYPSSRPQNIWWSEDGLSLFYQDVYSKQAWVYDLKSETSTQSAYSARTFDELVPEVKSSLPDEASVRTVSPNNRYVLYSIRLPEPVPLTPPRFKGARNPVYTAELWLYKNGETFYLGMIDPCFGALGAPLWSEAENTAVVNTSGTPDMPQACMHDVWLIDIESLALGPLDTPWEGETSYAVTDLSEEGQILLVNADKNYFYNRLTQETIPVPDADTNRAVLIDPEAYSGLIFKGEETVDEMRLDHLWYFSSSSTDLALLSTIKGVIQKSTVSPHKTHIALFVTDKSAGVIYEDVVTGVWLVELP